MTPVLQGLPNSLFPVRQARAALPAALLILALAGCGNESAAPPMQFPSAAVTVVTLQAETVALTRELPGRVSPWLVAEVRPQVSGIIKERLYNEGAMVKAGQALYQLDDASYRAEVARAEAALVRARALVGQARLTARRANELLKIEAISRQEQENATATLTLAEADVVAAEAALQSTRLTLGRARIVAPISGRVGKSAVTQGALVTANQTEPLVTIQQLDRVYIDVPQSSSEWLDLRREISAGTLSTPSDVAVQIVLEDGSVHAQPGRLAFSDYTVDPATGRYLVRMAVPNPSGNLLPGAYVRAVLANGERRNALLVPQQGIARDPRGNATAMVVNAEGKAEPRTLVATRTIGDKWLIDEGLKAGDRVIIEGLQKVRPGAPVNASEAAPPGAPAAPGASAAAGAPGAPAASGAPSPTAPPAAAEKK